MSVHLFPCCHVGFALMFHSHTCTCRATSMQCVARGAVAAASWTQETPREAARIHLAKRRLQKDRYLSTLDPRFLKCCSSLKAGTWAPQRKPLVAAGLTTTVQRWLACSRGMIKILIPSQPTVSAHLSSLYLIWWTLDTAFLVNGWLQQTTAATSKFDN